MTRRTTALLTATAVVAAGYALTRELVLTTRARAATAAREAACPDIPRGCYPTARCGIHLCYCPRVCDDASARPVWVDAPSECVCTA